MSSPSEPTLRDAEKGSKENENPSGSPLNDQKSERIEVTLDPSEDPKNLSLLKRWTVVLVCCSAALCVTCSSSMAASTFPQIQKQFHVGEEVAILSISLLIAGLGIGPLLLGPLSEFYGRNAIYRISFLFFFLLNFPVAFAPNIAVHLIFRFLSGFSGAAFLSVVGGTVSDVFKPGDVETPMAIYTLSPFIGPVVGPAISGFINQNADWRWTYYTLLIWIGFEIAFLVLFVPETYIPIILKWKAERLRKETGDLRYYAPLEAQPKSIAQTVMISCYKPFLIMFYEPMALLLNIWSALMLGIIYLTFDIFPVIFEGGYHFNQQMTGLSFLGLGIGMVIATASTPIWKRLVRRDREKSNGVVPPESRLYGGMLGGLLVPIGLFWFAFTIYPSVPWIVPIIASIPFGSGIILIFTSVMTFFVATYRQHAASAMASNSFVRSSFAAAFPLFARPMYKAMTNNGATAFLAGITLIMAPLPFIFYKIGPRLRTRSRYAS